MKQTILKSLMSIAVLLTSNAVWAYNFESEGIYYNILSDTDKTLEVTYKDTNHNSYTGEVAIPSAVTHGENTYSVTSIGEDAFFDCVGLISVTIPNSVTSIGNGAFAYCGLTTISIPNSVTSIGNGAFEDCDGLTSVTIPNSVTSIGNGAFAYCGLTTITIPNSVTSIGVGAFRDCNNLTSIIVEQGNIRYDSRENSNAILETATNSLIQGCNSTVIPNSVTSIGDYAFCGCGLTTITIPNSVTSIGEDAFEDCVNLNSVTIPNSVTSIGEDAFEDCESLINLIIPNSVTYIGEEAFEGCSSLTSVTIGRSVTIIGNYAFTGCENLGIVISLNTTPPSCGISVFDTSTTANAYLIVPQENVSMYEIYPTWKDFTNVIGKDLSGVEDMLVDDNNAPTEYYDLNGVRVQYPKNGVYIKRHGNKITKVVL